GLPFVGVGISMRRAPLDLLGRAASEYGDVVRLPLLGLPLTPMEPKDDVVVLNHPDLVTHVCVAAKDRYGTHAVLTDQLKRTLRLGEGELLTSSGEVWRRRKRILQPSFQGRSVAAASARIKLPIRRMLDAWEALPDDAVVDVEQAFTRMVADAFARIFLGV